MKITLYTISDCEFSKQEKDYLTLHKLPYEEKDLEKNKEYLTEMLAISNNFAGTPVTKIEKDGGLSVILKGFTKEEFDKELGLAPISAQVATPPPAAKPQAVANTNQPTTPQPPKPVPQAPTPTPTPPPSPTPIPPTTPTIPPSPPAAPQTPPGAPAQDQQLKSILSDLQSMSGPTGSGQPTQEPATPPTNGTTPKPPSSTSGL
ncbi:hypothetical protein A2866_01710 [Candidatus Roizmanbacteria bacterium RIFCSPHIGHO2_01_FULL_39_8]|uniref:Glutaredoxin domain-containing protein n=2 Tax=Candidatus Roizmaniibacteriota TaxID=1752723 RepID=A0A1F7GKF0_9BACT|nr:MAG: hypothetical protein A2866_01710 [Candidatus Roizmanbacteria bacterium RIFCSPHIGHO2_01_FULL_39_8]OGK36767.1 MAG: hypothetical protein A3F60_04900 [Candidatus Roizmanbacteria bacterium RIFCSPHIGHO2_12_FULL_39_8]